MRDFEARAQKARQLATTCATKLRGFLLSFSARKKYFGPANEFYLIPCENQGLSNELIQHPSHINMRRPLRDGEQSETFVARRDYQFRDVLVAESKLLSNHRRVNFDEHVIVANLVS